MRSHQTTDMADVPPVMYRHAKCKNCDHQLVYYFGATPDNNGKRPECPECGEQGIGGPFGRTNPAEYLPIVQQAAEGTGLEYRHWLAGDAAVRVEYRDHNDDVEPRWFYVKRNSAAALPCAITRAVDEDGTTASGWEPHTYQRYLNNGVEMTLVPDSDRPEEDWSR